MISQRRAKRSIFIDIFAKRISAKVFGYNFIKYQPQNESINIHSVEGKIMIEFKGTKEKIAIGIYDSQGMEIFKDENLAISTSDFSWKSISEASGLNVIIVQVGNKFCREKIFIEN